MKRIARLVPARLLLLILVLLTLAWAQQPPGGAAGRGPGGGSGGARGQQAPLPFLITRMEPEFDTLIDPDVKLETIVTIPKNSGEGPMWREGKLWFADQTGGNLYTVTTDGKLTVIRELAGGPINPDWHFNQGPNASVTEKDGTVLFCRQSIRDIARVNAGGTITPVIEKFEGKKFNAPNDLVFSADGALWFTDPAYSLPGWRDGNPAADSQFPVQGVYRYKDGKLTRPISDLGTPNGLGFSPDGKTFYVDAGQPKPGLHAYDVAADGTLSNERSFADFGVDGLKIDAKGDVWVTGRGGVSVFAPSGKQLGRIQFPTGASNMAWGEDLHSLFVTSGPSVYRLRTIVAGEKPMYYRP
jgi:gluconolactonase